MDGISLNSWVKTNWKSEMPLQSWQLKLLSSMEREQQQQQPSFSPRAAPVGFHSGATTNTNGMLNQQLTPQLQVKQELRPFFFSTLRNSFIFFFFLQRGVGHSLVGSSQGQIQNLNHPCCPYIALFLMGTSPLLPEMGPGPNPGNCREQLSPSGRGHDLAIFRTPDCSDRVLQQKI